MKKILSFVLCLCMLTGLAMPAFAAEEAADALIPPAALAIEEISATEEAPVEEEPPVEEEIPAEDVSVVEDTPAVEEAPVEAETPVEEEPPVEEETPAEDGATAIPGTNLFWDYDETTQTLTVSGTGAIPGFDMPQDTPWASLGTAAKALVIESGITGIGDNTFFGFVIDSVSIPATVTIIRQGAFYNCDNLTEVTIPEGVKTLEGEAFGGCGNLKTVYLPSTLWDYGNSEAFAFADCNAIENVYYNGSESLFSMYLGKSYFPETTEIHYVEPTFPLGGKVNDTITWELTEDYTLTITGTGAMPDYDHSSYTPWADYRLDIKKIVIGEGITHAGDCAFDWCSNVTEVLLPSTLESIGEWTFANGGGGPAIQFPEGLKTIGANAFHLNTLTEANLPESVTSVGDGAFAGGNIASIYVPGGCELFLTTFSNNPIRELSLGSGHTVIPECLSRVTTLTGLELCYPFETLSGDFIAKNEDLETLTMTAGEGRRFLAWEDEDGALLSCADILAGAEFSGDLTALWGEANPGDAPIPDSMTYWNVDDGVLTISGLGPMPDYTAPSDTPWARHLDDITAVVIEEGVTYVGDYTFDLCYNIGAMGLPNSLTGIGNAAFRGCGLEAVYIPGPCALADDAFDDNPIETLSLGEGFKAIPQCFSDVTTLIALELCYPFEVLSGDFIMQNEDLEYIIVAPEPVKGIELVEWMDDDLNVYFPDDLLMTDVSGKTLYAGYQYIWLDPGPFEDVDENDWFYDYVKYCYQNGIMNGTSETTFEPHAGATRAEVVTVLYRMAGEPDASADRAFLDVGANDWFADAVSWAASEGIAKGYGDGNFYPYSYVTREEFLVFLNRFAGYMELNLNTWSDHYHVRNYADYQYISSWAMEAEVWSVIMGLQTGVDVGEDTYLYPGDNILRSELATFLCRFMDGITSIMLKEAMQICVGQDGDIVKEIFGDPYYVYDVTTAGKCARCGETVTASYWYYDGDFAFVLHPDGDSKTVCYWGFTA